MSKAAESGDKTILKIIEASTSGEVEILENLLSQPNGIAVVLEDSNLERVLTASVEAGQPATVSVLMDFKSRHHATVDFRAPIRIAIDTGNNAIVKTLITREKSIIHWDLGPGNKRPLDYAVKRLEPAVIETLLEAGAAQCSPEPLYDSAASYRKHLLGVAASGYNTNATEVLLKHGFPIETSGALHKAALWGRLENMELLLHHGASLDELCPIPALPCRPNDRDLKSTWTPLHWAASRGMLNAMRLLEDRGAHNDIRDKNGRTPWQLLEEHKP